MAQLGRRLAEHLLWTQRAALIRAVGGIDPDVVETACLAHDLGHPPFGHIAEEELNRQVRDTAGVDDGYEGNAQSFRIVTKVAVRARGEQGLNLTRASLNAILKYPWPHGPGGKPQRKWGYYYSEVEDFDFARAIDPKDARRSAEAELMDWADDVTYAVHDVEDFYRVGIIPLNDLLVDGAERHRFLDKYESEYCDAKTKKERERRARQARDLFRDLQELTESLAPHILGPFSAKVDQIADLNTLGSQLITRYVLAISLTPDDKESVVAIEPRLRSEVDTLKALMRHYVFNAPALVAQQRGQRYIIERLFGILHDAAAFRSRDRGIIPLPYREQLDRIDKESLNEAADKRERARLVSDIIASLTEQQALDLHHRLMGIAPGSVLETIIRSGH